MKSLFVLVFTMTIQFVHAQNVGIHVTAPAEKLHVDSGNIKVGNAVWTSATNNYFLKFGDGDYVRIGESNQDDQMYMYAKSFVLLPSTGSAYTGNVGIGNPTPTEKLDVTGNIKVSGSATVNTLTLTGTGEAYDHLRVGTGGQVNAVKGYNALGINYIIATCGIFPSQGSSCGTYSESFLGEIRLFAGAFAPSGWAFCNGQLLPINQNQALFSLLGNNFGGNGQTTFALPDLRAAVPVHPGTNGPTWTIGQRTN